MKLHKNTRCFNLDDFIIQTMTTTIDDHTNCLVTSVSANYMWNCFYNLAIITFMFLEKLHDNDYLWQTTLVACRRKKRMIVEDGGARVQNPFLKILLGSREVKYPCFNLFPKVAFLQPTEPSVQLDDEGLSNETEDDFEVTLNDEADARNPRYLSMLLLSRFVIFFFQDL